MRKLRFSETTTLLLFLAAYWGLTILTWALFLRHPSETTFPLFTVHDLFSDLTLYRGKMLHLDAGTVPLGAGLPVFNYLAPAAYVYSWLLNTAQPVRTFFVVVGGSFVALLLGAGVYLYRRRALRPMHVLLLFSLLPSYPIAFLLSRSNLEGIVWVLVTAFLLLLLRGKVLGSALLLGLAISIKPFPVVFILVYAQRRKWLAVATSLAVALTVNLLALHRLGPTIGAAYRGLKPGVALYAANYVRGFTNISELSFGHGILDSLKVIYLLGFASRWTHSGGPGGQTVGDGVAIVPGPLLVLALSIGIATLVTMVWKLRRMPLENQLSGCCIALALFPPASGDYTLCSLYVPLLLIVYKLAEQTQGEREPWTFQQLLFLTLPCAVSMAPLRCFHSWMGPIHTLFLYVLLYGVLTIPLQYGRRQASTAHPKLEAVL